jgi:hypothetical protein
MLAVVAHVILAGSLLSQDGVKKIAPTIGSGSPPARFEHPVRPKIS